MMNGPLIRICIHVIFSTKDIMPLIRHSFEDELYSRITKKIEEEYSSYVRNIRGTENHIHILFMLNPSFRITDILKNIKNEFSHWINQNKFLEAKFSWQKSYDAFSVSETDIKAVGDFIDKQKVYHKNVTFPEERELFLKKYLNRSSPEKTV